MRNRIAAEVALCRMDNSASTNYCKDMFRIVMLIAVVLSLVVSPVAAGAHEGRMLSMTDHEKAMHIDVHSAPSKVTCDGDVDCGSSAAVCKAVCAGISVPVLVIADGAQSPLGNDIYLAGADKPFRENLPDEDSRPPISRLL